MLLLGPLIIIWMLGVAWGLRALWVYSTSPNENEKNPPIFWPAQKSITRSPGRPTLLMFAHPHCPCTRASVGELAWIMAHTDKKLDAYVLVFSPHSKPQKQWVETDIWRSSSEIPGVHVLLDPGSETAMLFHVKTSGHTLLYDPNGKLVFSGGITGARGHSGTNAGRSAVSAFLTGVKTSLYSGRVYGCSLIDPKKTEHQEESEK